jgi:Holliday junction resolvase
VRHGRVDKNQKQIVQELRQLGFSVAHISDIGKGLPDIIVGKNGINVLIEIKLNWTKKLKPLEEKFFLEWKGQVNIATSAEEVLQIFDKSKKAA